MRGISRSKSYARTEKVWREKIDYETGEIHGRYRKVTRRVDHLAGRSKGFLIVNDGPATASAISRYVAERTSSQLAFVGPLSARQTRILELRERLAQRQIDRPVQRDEGS